MFEHLTSEAFDFLQCTHYTCGKSQQYHQYVDFGMRKTVVIRIHFQQKWNAILFIKLYQFSYQKVCEISVKPKTLYKISSTYTTVLELFHIKYKFISFSLCCNHFTSLADEILYARKVDLFDKIKEIEITFSVCVLQHFTLQNASFMEWMLCLWNKMLDH
jgi:hypothetical protein